VRHELAVNAAVQHPENAADEYQYGGAKDDNHAVQPDIFAQ
jgi:hypothetical protein